MHGGALVGCITGSFSAALFRATRVLQPGIRSPTAMQPHSAGPAPLNIAWLHSMFHAPSTCPQKRASYVPEAGPWPRQRAAGRLPSSLGPGQMPPCVQALCRTGMRERAQPASYAFIARVPQAWQWLLFLARHSRWQVARSMRTQQPACPALSAAQPPTLAASGGLRLGRCF